MMYAREAVNVKNIFGSYIMSKLMSDQDEWNSKAGLKKRVIDRKKREQELFQVVDDYIEQA